MNEQLQVALAEVLGSVLSAKDFLLAEVPPVISQLLLWKFWEAVVWCAIGVALISMSLCFIKKSIEMTKAEPGWTQTFKGHSEWLVVILLARLVVGGVGTIMLCVNAFPAVQIWIAPKVYLIEYAAYLSK